MKKEQNIQIQVKKFVYMKSIIIFALLNTYVVYSKTLNHSPKTNVISPNSVGIKPFVVGDDLLKKKILLNCEICKNDFFVIPSRCKKNKVRFCSWSCFVKNKCTGKILKCIVCKKTFYKKPSQIKKNNFCSRSCSNKNKEKRIKKRCKNCKQNMSILPHDKKTRQYCSVSCMGNSYRTRLKGKKNPNYKKGISSINNRIRTTKKYKEWRISVFERDSYTCIWCHKKGVILNADHIKSFSLFPELRLVLSNGRTLCIDCHSKTDTFKKKITA